MNKKVNSPQKILIINTFGIGDVLFTTPLISNLKAHIPDFFLGYVGNRRTAPLLEENPKVNRVFIYERDEFYAVYQKSKIEFLRKIRGFFKEIQNENFDLVIDLSLNSSTSFWTWVMGIKKRIGFNYKNRSPFLTQKVPLKGYEDQHVLEYYLDLLKEMDIPIVKKEMELFINEEDQKWASEWLVKVGIRETDRVMALVPGGGASWGQEAGYKRWSPQNYAKLADKIVEKFSSKIILMGDPSEKELCARVADLMQHKPLQAAGETNILQFAALLQKCAWAVVNDGGPLHVAVAAGVKTVSLFGPVDERVYGPFPSDNHFVITNNIACRPCYRRFRMARCGHISCLRGLGVEDVFQKIEKQWLKA